MTILGIETSCDETAAAVYGSGGLRSNVIASQTIHERYGGVVPELASRAHQRTIWATVDQALGEAGCTLNDIEAVAVTNGPGLMGALLVGLCFAKGFALRQGIPLIGVNHMDAHIYANFIDDKPEYPFLGLVVSGGHTQIVLVEAPMQHTILGRTRDDAAGEAFDKTAKLMGLPYPGGPEIAKLAASGTPGRFVFPRPMTDRPGLDFSFSGLKTATLNAWQQCVANGDAGEQTRCDVALAFEQAVVETLTIKCKRALKACGLNRLVIAGGVSANRHLRLSLEAMAKGLKGELFYARPEFCTDNGAMIAYAGCQRLMAGQHDQSGIEARARWPMEELPPIS